jgi:hypothetical protein
VIAEEDIAFYTFFVVVLLVDFAYVFVCAL